MQGCAGTAPTCKVPSALELEIETSDRVNLDDDGRALPTLLRLYQLTDISRLQLASFEDMWEAASQTLAQTLVAVEELTIYPGQIAVRRFARDPKADFLVGFAVFRSPVGSAWRTIEEFPLSGDPCQERDDENAAPKLADLRIRMFLEDYRIESLNNYAALPKRSCSGQACRPAAAPNELPDVLRHRRLRDFEEDPSRPKPTAGADAK
jgi:type VI secretion system protein VasD